MSGCGCGSARGAAMCETAAVRAAGSSTGSWSSAVPNPTTWARWPRSPPWCRPNRCSAPTCWGSPGQWPTGMRAASPMFCNWPYRPATHGPRESRPPNHWSHRGLRTRRPGSGTDRDRDFCGHSPPAPHRAPYGARCPDRTGRRNWRAPSPRCCPRDAAPSSWYPTDGPPRGWTPRSPPFSARGGTRCSPRTPGRRSGTGSGSPCGGGGAGRGGHPRRDVRTRAGPRPGRHLGGRRLQPQRTARTAAARPRSAAAPGRARQVRLPAGQYELHGGGRPARRERLGRAPGGRPGTGQGRGAAGPHRRRPGSGAGRRGEGGPPAEPRLAGGAGRAEERPGTGAGAETGVRAPAVLRTLPHPSPVRALRGPAGGPGRTGPALRLVRAGRDRLALPRMRSHEAARAGRRRPAYRGGAGTGVSGGAGADIRP